VAKLLYSLENGDTVHVTGTVLACFNAKILAIE